MASFHTEHYTIRTSEINHRKLLHPHALIQLMQEASMQHTINMKVSVWDMASMNASWVLLKMEVKILHYPSLNETVRIDTYPSGLDGYFTFRDYLMYDGQGELCATSTTMWSLMNLDTRKIMKIPESFGSLVYHAATPLGRPDFKLSSFVHSDTASFIQVNYLQIDWNGHVNNGQLVKLIIEQLQSDILTHKKLTSLIIQFKAEALLDQILSLCYSIKDNTIKHSVKDKNSDREVLIAESTWEPIEE